MKRFIRSVEKTVQKMDVFSKEVQLLIKKKEGHKTVMGGVFTLAIIIIVFAQFVNSIIKLNQNQNPNVYQSEVLSEIIPEINLLRNNFTLQFSFSSSNQSNYIDESIYNIKAFIVLKNITIQDGQQSMQKVSQELPIIKCSQIGYSQLELQQYFSKFNSDSKYCINWENITNITLMGSSITSTSQTIEILFTTCQNTTGKLICKDKDTIVNTLKRNYLSIQISSINYDYQNYLNPHNPVGQDITTSVSSQVYKEISISMQPISTQTDQGVIFESIEQQSTIIYQNNVEITDVDQTTDIIKLIVELSSKRIINYRSYTKLQVALSQVGGLWSVLFTIFYIIQIPFNYISYYVLLVNSLFTFENETYFTKQEKYTLSTEQNEMNTQLKNLVINSNVHKLKKQNASHSEKEKSLQKLLGKFFSTTKQKLNLRFSDYIQFFFQMKQRVKVNQLRYSITRIQKSLDILYIIKKLSEIDKLKMVLLNQEQLHFFDYLPNPTIKLDPEQISQTDQYFSVLAQRKKQKQKAQEAQNSFDKLLEDMNNPINKKLISLMNSDIISIMKLNNESLHKHSEQNYPIMITDQDQILDESPQKKNI